MRVELNYGRSRLAVDLDPAWDVTVVRKPDMPALADPAAALEAAFDAPAGAARWTNWRARRGAPAS